jgi:hypothetical protein
MRRRAVGIALGVAWMLAVGGGPAASWAAPVSPPPAAGAASSKKDEKKDEEPTHRVMLLGSTIYGAVSAPNAVYDVPWQEPFMLGKGAGELDRNFLMEIFKPVDRDEFLKQSSPSKP